MKAMQYTAYGDSNVIKPVQVDKPVPKDDEVLIKVEATTVNPLDVKIRNGAMKQHMPIEMPWIPGSDVAGTVEAAGSHVSKLKPGDKIFGSNFGGAYAGYIAISEKRVALKPSNTSADEAAALVVPLNTAYTVLIDVAHLQKGQKVLIHGASGAVGSVMTQMAKSLGAYVIASVSASGMDLARQHGADEVIDYKKQDFTQLVKDVDVVIDPVGGDTQKKSFEVLKKGGQLLSIVSPPDTALAEKYGVTAKFIQSNPTREKLEYGRQLVEEGKIKASVAKVMKLEQAAEAQDLLSKGGVNGKIVLEIQ